MMRVGVGVVALDLLAAQFGIERLGFDERPVGVEAQRRHTLGAGRRLDRRDDPPRDAEAARFGRGPHALDLALAVANAPEPAAADRLAVEPGEEEEAGGRRQIRVVERMSRLGIEAALEAPRELGEIFAKAPTRLRGIRRGAPNLVNRLGVLTAPSSTNARGCDAERRQDPAPNNTLFVRFSVVAWVSADSMLFLWKHLFKKLARPKRFELRPPDS